MTEPWTIYNNTTITALLTEEQHAAFIEYDEEYNARFSAYNKNGYWELVTNPEWFGHTVYRAVKTAPTKPSIDWSHVAPQFKWLAQDSDGTMWLCAEKPTPQPTYWFVFGDDAIESARAVASAKPGTCDWKDSLVQRPEGVRK